MHVHASTHTSYSDPVFGEVKLMPEGCSCQVNVLQCTLEGGKTVVGKYIRWKSVPLGYCSWKEAVFVVVVGGGFCLYLCGWLDLVWLCPGLRYLVGLVSKR